ncbi:uncharacterized mitochondrial protein AtMg00810-like [Rutidosis leptorrhynchoides]|uniref:uncharacterized mitochondrial protein AtMg00810-like n=1 Tax=Rutidosis leptorrhynchoides TaxID=125765 RepID=UPI003A990440
MENSKPMATPMATNVKLTLEGEGESFDSTKYRGMIGSLLYLTDGSSQLSSFLGIAVTRQPNSLFLQQTTYAKEITERAGMSQCNLVRTPVDTSAKLSGSSSPPVANPTEYSSLPGALLHLYKSSSHRLIAYTDANWAGCPDTRRSTSGYYVYFEDNLISWSSKRQHTLSRSSTEAEYRGVANVVSDSCWVLLL